MTTLKLAHEINSGSLTGAYQLAKKWAIEGMSYDELERRIDWKPEQAQWLYKNGFQAGLDEIDDEEGPESLGCECEIDWNCHLHKGRYTALELQNDAWATEQDFRERGGYPY